MGSVAFSHIIWQKCLYKQSSWSADSVIWFGIKQSVASHLLSYARVLERLGFYWYCPITLTGIWKIRISLDICHWNCWPYPRGLSRPWHQSPNQKKNVSFSHIVADSESCHIWPSAMRLESTCLTKSYNSSCSWVYESVHELFKPCLLMTPKERTPLAYGWLLCRNSCGFCHLSNLCHRDSGNALLETCVDSTSQSLPSHLQRRMVAVQFQSNKELISSIIWPFQNWILCGSLGIKTTLLFFGWMYGCVLKWILLGAHRHVSYEYCCALGSVLHSLIHSIK